MRSVAAFLPILLVLCYFVPTASARVDTTLPAGWRFHQGEVAGAQEVGFDDSDWQTLSLPHSWGWEEAQQGRNYRREPGWYRRELILGPPEAGRRSFIRFEAAGSVADVYLNGNHLGQHRGAFGAFCYELTPFLSAEGTNLLAVRVSNAPEPDIAPLSGDFCVFGGLYRPVHLIETGEVCFNPTDHGSRGVVWAQREVSMENAELEVTVQVSNRSRDKQKLVLWTRVLGADGEAIAETERDITLMPKVTEPFWVNLTIPHPRLWNGRKDPYLYTAITELRSGEIIVDKVEQPLGLRFYRVDPEKGFVLNGSPYPVHGVNRHQDRQDQGWAITEADQDQDLAMILEMGCTAVRCAHYQHSDYFYSLCDKAGLLVWAEIPQVDRVSASPKFAETSRNQLLDLIRQNINHPSIFAWSLYNELRPNNPDPHRLLQDLKLLANGEDPSRPTIAATCTSGWPQMNKITDLLGWNIYPGWYSDWGPLSDYQDTLARYNDSRHGGICISEYGAGGNPAQHEQNPKQPKNDGQWHPEEYQAHFHEEAWKGIKSQPYIWGAFIWNMFDFTSYWRNEGGIKGRNDKGLVTYDRQIKKDAFYFYKASWSDEPTLYITSRRHTLRTNAATGVKVYSNANKVELLLNGLSQGERNNDGNSVFIWQDRELQPGENTVRVTATIKGQSVEDSCVWTFAE